MSTGDRVNFSGDLPFTAPVGGVIRGRCYKINETYIVARETAAAGATFLGAIFGPVTATKATGAGTAFAIGDAVYFITASNLLTSAPTGNTLIGKAIGSATTTGTEIDLILTQSEV